MEKGVSMKGRPILIGTQHAAGATAITSAEGSWRREPPTWNAMVKL